jgi:hypothetical protein
MDQFASGLNGTRSPWGACKNVFNPEYINGIQAPLCIGKIRLSSGSQVSGFICEPYGIEGAEEITRHGGWKGYLNR